MASKLGTFLATCLALGACLAGMSRLYVAVSAVPLGRLSPAAPAAKPVKPILLPAEPVAPDFGYSDEAREPEEGPDSGLQGAAVEADPRSGAAAAREARREPEAAPPAERTRPPEKKVKTRPAPRPAATRQSVRELLEQARQRAGKLQRVGFRQNEAVMYGSSGGGADASQAAPEGPAAQSEAAQGGGHPASAGPSGASPAAAPQRTMRAVSIGGNNQPAGGSVQRADETPAIMSDNPGQFEPPDSTQ